MIHSICYKQYTFSDPANYKHFLCKFILRSYGKKYWRLSVKSCTAAETYLEGKSAQYWPCSITHTHTCTHTRLGLKTSVYIYHRQRITRSCLFRSYLTPEEELWLLHYLDVKFLLKNIHNLDQTEYSSLCYTISLNVKQVTRHHVGGLVEPSRWARGGRQGGRGGEAGDRVQTWKVVELVRSLSFRNISKYLRISYQWGRMGEKKQHLERKWPQQIVKVIMI